MSVKKIHETHLAHHVEQAAGWLGEANQGINSAALTYAALELRFAVERLAVHYWSLLLNRKLTREDIAEIKSFKRLENRIYQLAGHQKRINKHFEFMQIVLRAMKIERTITAPNIGKLSQFWHTCSELCHVTWPLSSTVPEVQRELFQVLSNIRKELLVHFHETDGWPILQDDKFKALRDRYVSDTATEDDILLHLQKAGVWGRVEYPGGRAAQFIGQPIPQNSATRDGESA